MSSPLRIFLLFISSMATMLLPNDVRGADIKKIDRGNGGAVLIFVAGPIVSGDDKRFLATALSIDSAIVVLESPGGIVRPSLEIGKIIRMKGFSTAVVSGECQSACGLIWLAGLTRYLAKDGGVGFHAAYRINQDGTTTESGRANALVGAYLNSLGLPEKAIEYISSAPPNAMQLLNYADATRFGIHTTFLDNKLGLENVDPNLIGNPANKNPQTNVQPPAPTQPKLKVGSDIKQGSIPQGPNSKPASQTSTHQSKPVIQGYRLHVCRVSDTNIFYSANLAVNGKTSFTAEKNVDLILTTIKQPLTISLNVLGRHSTFHIPYNPADKFLIIYFHHYIFGPRIDGFKFTELSNFVVKGVNASEYFALCAAERTTEKVMPP